MMNILKVEVIQGLWLEVQNSLSMRTDLSVLPISWA